MVTERTSSKKSDEPNLIPIPKNTPLMRVLVEKEAIPLNRMVEKEGVGVPRTLFALLLLLVVLVFVTG